MAINKGKIKAAAQRHAEKGNYDRAIEEYLKIVKEDPKDAAVFLKIGELFAKKGDKKEALAHFRQAADIFFQEGFDVKAAGVLKQILAFDPTDVDSSIALARYYKTKGLTVDALTHLETIYRWLVRHERTEEALKVAREMVSLDPDNVAMRIRLAEAFSREERRSEAVAEFAVAADLLRSAERIDDFIKVAERLLWHQPDNVAISKELATLYLRKKEPRRALQKLQVCFKSDPQDVETLELLAEAFEQLEQVDKAATILKELAKVYVAQGKRDAATDVYARVLDMDPGDQDARQALDELRPAKPSEAFHQVHTMPVGHRVNQTARPVEAVYSGAQGEHGQPELLDDEDIEELPDDAIVEIEEDEAEISRMLNETDVFVRYRLFDKALAHLERILENSPDHVEALRRRAEVLGESGRIPEAVEAYRRLASVLADSDAEAAGQILGEALSLAPDDEELARDYERLTGKTAPVMEAVEENDFDEDLADLSGLQLLEDIEAEAEVGESVYATQELSFQGRKSPFVNPTLDGESEEVDLAQMADLGLLDEVDESGDIVNLGDLADAAIFDGNDEQVSPDATIQEGVGALMGTDVLAAAGMHKDIDPGATVSDAGGGLTAEQVRAAAGMSDSAADQPDDDSLVFSDDLDLELDKLEEEFGALSASREEEEDQVGQGEASKDIADTAMVSMEAFERAVAEQETDSGDDLDLVPPSSEFDETEASDIYEPEDMLGDELEQLEETGALIARLEKETGNHDEVEDFASTTAVPTVPGSSESAQEAVDSELDFSGLMDDDLDAPAVEPTVARDEDRQEPSPAAEDSQAAPEDESFASFGEPETTEPAGQSGPAEQDVGQSALDELVEEAELALGGDLVSEADAEPAEADSSEASDGQPALEIATSELQIDDLAAVWGADGGGAEDAGPDEAAQEEAGAADADQDAGSVPTEEPLPAQEESAESSDEGMDSETLENLQADIEDTEFFIEQGLYHDALGMLEDLREQYGSHPLLEKKIEEVRSAAGQELVGEEEDEDVGGDEDTGEAAGASAAPSVKQSVKVVGQAGGEALGDGDAETHFDLGIAYRDMGLLDQAIEEFRKVTHSPSRAVQAHLMIAGCLMDKGQLEEAVAECESALDVETISKVETLETYYQIANLRESMGDREQALYWFQKIVEKSSSYRDVAERIESLLAK